MPDFVFATGRSQQSYIFSVKIFSSGNPPAQSLARFGGHEKRLEKIPPYMLRCAYRCFDSRFASQSISQNVSRSKSHNPSSFLGRIIEAVLMSPMWDYNISLRRCCITRRIIQR